MKKVVLKNCDRPNIDFCRASRIIEEFNKDKPDSIGQANGMVIGMGHEELGGIDYYYVYRTATQTVVEKQNDQFKRKISEA